MIIIKLMCWAILDDIPSTEKDENSFEETRSSKNFSKHSERVGALLFSCQVRSFRVFPNNTGILFSGNEQEFRRDRDFIQFCCIRKDLFGLFVTFFTCQPSSWLWKETVETIEEL